MSKKERGRPMCSHQVHAIPEYRETPDMEKLGKALIAIAASIAEKKKAETASSAVNTTDSKAVPAAQPTEGRAA